MKWRYLAGGAALAAMVPALIATAGVAVAQNDPIHGGGAPAPAAVEEPAAAADMPAEGRTVQDGVYTDEQADRGFEAYRARGCVGCHGEDMHGTPGGPNITGFIFMFHWQDQTVGDVFSFLQNNMPPGAAGSLSSQAYTDVLAAIFRANGFPAGDTELDPENLDSILIAPAAE